MNHRTNIERRSFLAATASLALAAFAGLALAPEPGRGGRLQGQAHRVDHPLQGKAADPIPGRGSTRPLLSANLPGSPVVAVKNIPGGGSDQGSQPVPVEGQAHRAHDPRHLRIDPVPLPAGRQAGQGTSTRTGRFVLATATGGVFYVSPETGVQSAADIARLRGPDPEVRQPGRDPRSTSFRCWRWTCSTSRSRRCSA